MATDFFIHHSGNQYEVHPAVTSDRVCPKWFLRELNLIDPLLRVEYWNLLGKFRLVRVLPDGRWNQVCYFRVPDSHFLRVLRESDTHLKDFDPVSRKARQIRRDEILTEYRKREKRNDEQFDRLAEDELVPQVMREAEAGRKLYSYRGLKRHGVESRAQAG